MVSKVVKVAAPIIGVITAVIIIVVIIVTTTDNIEETGMYIRLPIIMTESCQTLRSQSLTQQQTQSGMF